MVVFIVSASTERAFEQFDRERTAALVQQFRKEFAQRGEEVARAAVRVVAAGDNRLYVVAGRRLDQTFLLSLVLPSGTRALLYLNLEPAFSVQALAGVSPGDARRLAPLIEKVRQQNREATGEIQW